MASYIDPSFRLSLTRQPSERTSQDLTLINAHLKSLEALSSFRDSTIRALCKTVRYEKHEANDVLYRTGDVINNWFILLSGSVFIDGSMYLPRSGFGRRSAGQTHRIHDCLVLETSEMLVIDYPKQVSQSTLSPLNINTTTTTSNNEPHVHRSNTNGTTTVAVNGASEPVAISSSLSIPTSSSLDSDVLNQRIMIKHTSPKLTTFATLASSVNSYEESTTLHSSSTRVHHCVVDDTTSNNKLIKTTSFQVKADKLKVISTSPTSTSTSTAIHQPYNSNHLNVNVSAMSHSTTSETTTANSLVVGGNDDRMSLDDDDDEGDIEDDEHGEQDLHNLNILCNDSVVDSPLIVDSSQHIKSICIITGNSAYRPHSKKGSQSNSNPSNNNNQIVVKHHPFKSSPSSVSGYNEPTSWPLALPTADTTTTTTMTTTTTTNEEVVTSSSTLQPPPKLVTTQLLVKSTSLTTPPSRPAAHHQHTNSCSSSISSTSAIKSNSVDVAGIRAETASVASVASNKQPDEDRLSAVSSAPTTSKDVVREVLEKDPKERTDEDIDLLFEFMQTLPAFSNLTEPIVRKLCACMVIGVVEKADTLVLDHNERLDSWAVVLNGHVECTLPDGSIKAYHIGDHFGVSPVLDAVYHQGVMRTKCDDCQFVLVKQADYHDILNKGKENTRSYYEPGSQKVCMLCELRPIGGGDISSAQISTMSSSQLGEIVLRATPDKLVERLVWDDVGSILDPTYIQDFLLTYRVFIDSPVYISKRLFDWFMNPESLPALNNSNSSPSINRYQQSTTNGGVSSTMKKKVYRIVLEWITNHFNDFESNRELYDFVERFQEQLSKEKMYEQFRVLSIAISTKSKQRVVTLARSKRDDALMFTIQGGWEKGYGIFVSRVERETKAHELGLRRGDQIIEVNGHSFMHITLAQATETLKSFTHASITVKYNPIGFNEMLLHPEKSPHRNKKSGLANNNKAYLIEYLKQQQNHYQQQIHGTPTTIPMDSPQSPQLNNNNVVSAKKSIGSIPPLPPSASTNSLTPRNKSKDKPPASSSASHFKLLSSTTSSNLKSDSAASTGSASSNTNQIRKILGRFNRKAHSKDLEHLSQVDSSAPALKSITRSPSPSFSAAANFHQASNSAKPPTNGAAMLTSDYSSSSALSLSRNNSISNLNDIEHQQQQAAFDSSLARMSLQDQQQFVGEHVLKIYKNDQNFKYLVVHKETSTKEVVMLALNEFNIIDDIGSNAYSLCEVSVDADRVIKQKRLPDQLNNLAERLPLNARYYLKCNTSPEQFLSDPGAADELIKDSSSTFLQLDALELAAQLTLRDYCLFKSIESSEYIDALFRKNAPPPEHLSKFADLSNEEMFWVVNEILHESSLVKRVRIIKQFIQIAHICRECKNFNSLFAILSGLDHLSVTRLKDTWDKVSNKHKKLLHELKTILDPSFNMMKYRNLFKNELIQPPIIPFFPICQKDLYFLKESCETVIDGLINFEKLRKLSKSVRSIVQMTSSPFDLTSMRDVPTSHSVIFSMFGCTNPGVLSEYSLVNSSGGGVVGSTSTATVSTLGSVVSAKLTNIAVNVKADHVKKMYEEAVMVRKVRHYLAQMSRTVEKNEERLRLISSTLEHSTSTSGANNSTGMGAGNTLKRNPQSASSSNHYHHKPSPNSSLGGSVSSINAALNLSGGQAGISSGNGPLMTNKNALFGAHSPDAVKKLLALSETKVKTVKNSSSSSSVPLSQMSNSSRLLLNTSSSSSMVGGVNAAPIITTTSPTSSSSVAALSPKTKHRSVSSSQPIPPQTSTSASNVVASQSATSANSSASKYTLSSSNTETNNSKSKKNDKMTIVATNGSGIKSANEADSGRASMASNVDQEQCSPTFQQRAFVLNRYLSSDQQYKSTNKVFINTAMTTSGSTRQQAPKAPPLNGSQQVGGEMLSNAQILKNHMRNSSNGVSETPLNNQNGLEEEEDQVSAV